MSGAKPVKQIFKNGKLGIHDCGVSEKGLGADKRKSS